jgi:hypothetical protein
LQADGLDFVPVGELPSDHRYFTTSSGRDYRDETEGDHPITDLRPVHAN